AANLRRPDAPAAPPPHDRLPPLAAEPFAALGKHHVDHVFATWYAPDRRSNILLVVDASGSMGDPAPGTATPLIELVRRGARSLTDLLPDDSRVGVWEFGSELAGTSDHRVLLSSGDLAGPHRARLNATIDKLAARRTGTGLYDTILNAYRAGVSFYRPGLPNHVLVFTDGRNQDDAGSISLAQLGAGLARAQDPRRPVQLSVVAFGQRAEAERLEAVFEPVDGYVGTVGSPEEVAAVFIHQAAGGLHAH
ncbi:MAG TPA: VWA domain-containing protein, partial [Pilimelia sp.]|nr:VWA domain-containing protein [Pilimelia sp.]